MYPLELFLGVMAIDGAVTLYALMHHGADYYKDIGAWVFAVFLSGYLALGAVSGTAYIYSTSSLTTLAIQDDGLMWIFILIMFAQIILGALELLEAYEEHQTNKTDIDENRVT
jgi:hypothetical protein